MGKMRWVFCENCGQAFKTSSITTRFCSKKCMDSWASGNNMENFGSVSNTGDKNRKKYKAWRKNVLSRYGNVCALCGKKEKSLHSHHIVPWFEDESLRYDVKNGVALCKDCHSIVHGFEIFCKSSILKDFDNVSNIRKRYISVCGIKYKRG